MSTPHNDKSLGKPLRNKKKRSAVFIVVVASIAVHVLGLGGLAAIKIIEVLQPAPEFEAPPVQAVVTPPPPPPPPPPKTRRTQRSLTRPQPLAAVNPQNMAVPAIAMQESDLSIGGGRGFGGGLGEIGGGAMDSIRLTSFGFDRALEGTLEGTLYDFKQDAARKPIARSWNFGDSWDVVYKFQPIVREFTRSFDAQKLNRKFYKADKKLYASYFAIPMGPAAVAPKSFGVAGEIEPTLMGAYYQGTYKPRETGRFRLVGKADDVLIVRINDKIVLDGSIGGDSAYSNWRQNTSSAKADKKTPKTFFGFSKKYHAITGDWFNLREGSETKVEVFVSEVPGGTFGAYILIEKDGEPGLKIFSTRPLSDQDKTFLRKLHPDAAQFLN